MLLKDNFLAKYCKILSQTTGRIKTNYYISSYYFFLVCKLRLLQYILTSKQTMFFLNEAL